MAQVDGLPARGLPRIPSALPPVCASGPSESRLASSLRAFRQFQGARGHDEAREQGPTTTCGPVRQSAVLCLQAACHTSRPTRLSAVLTVSHATSQPGAAKSTRHRCGQGKGGVGGASSSSPPPRAVREAGCPSPRTCLDLSRAQEPGGGREAAHCSLTHLRRRGPLPLPRAAPGQPAAPHLLQKAAPRPQSPNMARKAVAVLLLAAVLATR